MADELQALHHELFGFTPNKSGVAYERLAAVVLAALGWQEVTHNVKKQPLGKLAEHQLDVVAHAPDGKVRRLIIECKDYSTNVKKGVLDTLVGVRQQVGADAAAVVTTVGFSAGARAVATDEDIALLRLRHFDPATEKGNFIMKVVIQGTILSSHTSNFGFELGPSVAVQGTFDIALTGSDRLSHVDGTPAETIDEVVAKGGVASAKGVYQRRVEFPDERLIQSTSGAQIAIKALTWTETMDAALQTQVIEKKGTPVLVLEQLDSGGSVSSGRLVVSEDLYAWDIDSQGAVHARGKLVP